MDFNAASIEQKWRKYWQENKTYKVTDDVTKPKYYVLDMFPYPSGAGLHVGHPLGYIASDIYARYKRQTGFNVLHPMGYDAFGLPAEQYALQMGVHPAKSTADNIKKYRNQLDNMGLSFDWDREVLTSDPDYYKWTQTIFIKLFHHYYNTETNKATEINDLIKEFEATGNAGVKAHADDIDPFTAEEWNNMSIQEKDDTLMAYRLAYRKISYVNWCEELGTVLANDEVKDGVSERGGYPVEKKAMKQWSLRITAYADRLLSELADVEWSDSLKAMQANWIGRSEGAQMFFDLEGSDEKIEIFTTRPDTIFGSTYMVLAPEHDLVDKITSPAQSDAISTYKKYVASRSEVERMSEVKEVTGAFTGAYAINPFNQERIPVWIGEYVLKDYGTGAIMAVPSDDDRDKVFAQKFGLPIIDVVDKSEYPDATLHDKLGTLINSDFLTGMQVPEAIEAMMSEIETRNLGKRRINYRLRDANFSRQRYWGEPFPIYYTDEGETITEDLDKLPVELPYAEDFKPGDGGKSPLAKLDDWIHTEKGRRETDTMPGFAGSSWYFLRYMDAKNPDTLASQDSINYWQDVDLYVGGTEHAVGHLMYSRFWHKFLYDKGIVPTKEPFKKLVNQGMIQGVIEYLYLKKEKAEEKSVFVSADMIEGEDGYARIPVYVGYITDYGTPGSHLTQEGLNQFVAWRPDYNGCLFTTRTGTYDLDSFPDNDIFNTKSEVGKMSKRYFNVINPDDVVARYGADCFRMYEMFLGPIEQSKPWDINGIDGVSKFLRKLWSLFYTDGKLITQTGSPTAESLKTLHTAIKKISVDIERLSLNTAVSSFMVCVNELKKQDCHNVTILTDLVKLLAPFAPFITEELYEALGYSESVHHTAFPVFNEEFLKEDSIEYPVCINGKKRDMYKVGADVSKEDIEKAVLALPSVIKWMEGKPARKVIVVPNRMINVVV